MKRTKKTKDCKGGCDLGGNRPHSCSTGGIPTIVEDTDNEILVESGEVIITKPAVQDTTVKTYTGTNKEILNQINTSAGGNRIMKRGGQVTKGKTTKKSKTMKKTKIGKCPRGMKVQTILFEKDMFTDETAKRWCQKHGYKKTGEDITENKIRIRQLNPEKFDSDSFRTITFGKGIKAVVGCPVETMKGGGNINERKVSELIEDIKVIESAIDVTDNAADKKQLVEAKKDLEKEVEILLKGETPKEQKQENVIDSEKVKEITEKIEKIESRLKIGKNLMAQDEIELNENKIKKLQKELSELTSKQETKQKLSKDKDKPTKAEMKEIKEIKPIEKAEAKEVVKKETEVKKPIKRVKKQVAEKKPKRVKKITKEISSGKSIPLTRGRCQQTIAPYIRETVNCKEIKRVKKSK